MRSVVTWQPHMDCSLATCPALPSEVLELGKDSTADALSFSAFRPLQARTNMPAMWWRSVSRHSQRHFCGRRREGFSFKQFLLLPVATAQPGFVLKGLSSSRME